jgi:hypothetical protein
VAAAAAADDADDLGAVEELSERDALSEAAPGDSNTIATAVLAGNAEIWLCRFSRSPPATGPL